jgi:hypothetical protein
MWSIDDLCDWIVLFSVGLLWIICRLLRHLLPKWTMHRWTGSHTRDDDHDGSNYYDHYYSGDDYHHFGHSKTNTQAYCGGSNSCNHYYYDFHYGDYHYYDSNDGRSCTQ